MRTAEIITAGREPSSAMTIQLAILMTTTVILLQATGQAMGQCNSYTELNDTRRSTNYTKPEGETGMCDSDLAAGWYRFTSKAGGEIPEFCPERNQCGTLVPVWMNGTHPTVEDGFVDRTLCSYYGTNPEKPCCDHTDTIFVINCGDFFVYHLEPIDTCPVAYCAGSKGVCPAGQWSSDGFFPCEKVYPLMETGPTFRGPNIQHTAFFFTCTVDYPDNDPDLRFEVQWTVGSDEEAVIRTEELTEPNRVSILSGKELKGKLNNLLRCWVRGWYNNRSVLQKSPWITSSDAYYVGVTVEPPILEMTDSATEAKVLVTSTLPILCGQIASPSCCISINVGTDGSANTVDVADQCSYKLCTGDWNPQTLKGSREVSVAVSKSRNAQPTRKTYISFQTIPSVPGEDYLNVFSDHSLPVVSVTVQQSSPFICTWVTDPHITGFSGNLIHLYEPGNFTMYKNKKDDFEVQSHNYVCWNRAACECGLLIREQNDIIHINNCADKSAAPFIETTQPLREGVVIKRSRNGRTILVVLPSGRQVKLEVWSSSPYYHITTLTVPASDAKGGNGRGICGTPDDRSDNEYTYGNGYVAPDPCANNVWGCVPTKFFESWRVSREDSYFHNAAPNKVYPDQPARYCQCDKDHSGQYRIDCREPEVEPNLVCNGNCGRVTTDNVRLFRAVPIRLKKAVADVTDMDEPDLPSTTSQPDVGVSGNQTWPTASGITEEQAREQCESSIRSSQLFSQYSGDSNLFQDNVDNCMLDIMLGDTFDGVEAIVAAFTDGCQFELMQDINNYDTDDQGNLVLKTEVTNVCATDCLRHGSCVNGTCVCDQGYTGSSCQLRAEEPPRLLRIQGSDVCDVNQQSCRKVYMDAEGFEWSDNFLCRIEETTVGSNGYSDGVVTDTAHFITDAVIACPLPDAKVKSERSVKTFSLSFTYDGSTYSNVLNVTVFDSTCQNCKAMTCQSKPNTCHINNLCYRDGDVNPDDKNRVCKPSESTSKWTEITTPGKSSSSPLSLYVLLFVSSMFIFWVSREL